MPTTLEERFDHFRRSGDPDALGAIYDEVAPRLLRTAIHVAASAAQAEDVLQATFLAAIERREHWDRDRPLLPWLLGILTNQARLARWRARRTPDPERVPAPAAAIDPAAQAAGSEFTAAVDAALDALPAPYRPVLVLHLRHAMTPTDIAHALDRPPGTVRAQLARGLERLRSALPAGIAGAMFAGFALGATPLRGLAAVRAAVLARASLVPTANTMAAATALLGGLAMHKLVPAAAALLAATLVLGASAWPRPEVAPSRAMAAAPEPVHVRPTTAEAHTQEVQQALARQAVPAVDEGEGLRPSASARALHPDVELRLRGRAVWEEDGTPAAGVRVSCQEPGGPPLDVQHAVTGEDGTFAFSLSGPPRPLSLCGDRGGETTVQPRQDRMPVARLVIPRGCEVTGMVRDEQRQPVPGAGIWLSDRYLPEGGSIVAHADREGRYRVRNVGRERYLGARSAGLSPSPVHYV